MQDHPKWDRQVSLEEDMRSLGIERFHKALTEAQEHGQETEAGAIRRLLGSVVLPLAEAIRGFLKDADGGQPGRRHLAARYLVGIEPEVAALLALKGAFDRISKKPSLAAAAIQTGGMIEDELHFRHFRDQEKDKVRDAKESGQRAMNEFEHVVANLNKRTQNQMQRRRGLAFHAKKHGVVWTDWDTRTKLLVGLKLVELLIEATGLVERVTENQGKHQMTYLVPTEATSQWLTTENLRCEALSPVYLPTIIPPKPWTSPTSGGYWTRRVRGLRLIKTNNRPYLEELAETDLSEVYAAVNAMQETAWAINGPVLATMLEMQAIADRFADRKEDPPEWFPIPPSNPLNVPLIPADLAEVPTEAMDEGQLGRLKQWKGEARMIYDANITLRGKRAAFHQLLNAALRMKDEEEFFFPYQLDFRGRVYAVPLGLQPQGNDMAKALLQFANAVPIGDEEGARWLAIHGAGLWGVDKCGMDERVQWVLDHEEEILASARDPFENRFWAVGNKEEKKRWQALAFCFEWAGFRQEGYEYLSHLPIQMDGTCNGLQNFSAMLLDEVGGAAVNLLPADKPSDIYQVVADRVALRVEQDAFDGVPEAQGWRGNVTRSVTKRPVMTLPYGAQQFGFNQQVFTDTVKKWKSEKPHDFPFVGSGWDAAAYLGGIIWDEVGNVVVKAREAMDWLKGAATRAAEQGLPVRWTTPAGLVVQQVYEVEEEQRIKTTFGGGAFKIAVRKGTGELDKRKQASAIAPNFVHSLDAAHLMRTVNACRAKDIRSFSLIHDSYGTHAGNAWAMAASLREEFVGMYSERDILVDFKAELEAQMGDPGGLPALPKKGSLDLAKVLESQFFFA